MAKDKKAEKPKSNTYRPNVPDALQAERAAFEKALEENRDVIAESTRLLLDKQKVPNIKSSFIDQIFMQKVKSDANAQSQSRTKQLLEVKIIDIDNDLLRKLNFGSGKKSKSVDETKDENTSSLLEKIIKFAIPLVAIGGTLLGSLSKMISGDPFQGVFTILAKSFSTLFNGFFGKLFATKGGLLRNLSAKIFGKGGIIMKMFGTGTSSVAKAFGVGGRKGLLKVLGRGFLKRIPIIGSIISLGDAFIRFKNGQIIQGLMAMGSAVATMVPGVGTAIAIALDVMSATIDTNRAKGGGLSGAVDGVSKWIKDNARNLPIIGTVTRLGEALAHFVGGDVKEGFKSLMGAGFALIPGMGLVYDLIVGDTTGDVDENGDQTMSGKLKDGIKSIYTTISDTISAMIQGMIQWIVDRLYSIRGMPDGLIGKGLDMMGLSSYKKGAMVDAEEDLDNTNIELAKVTSKYEKQVQLLSEGDDGWRGRRGDKAKKLELEMMELRQQRINDQSIVDELKKMNESGGSVGISTQSSSNTNINNFGATSGGSSAVKRNGREYTPLRPAFGN